MNVSLSPQATGSAAGASSKTGKSGDPLADFMALLGQLGISVEGDAAATVTDTAAGPKDAAVKLLATLAKTIEGGDKPVDSKDEKGKKDDSTTTLADLLAKLDPGAASGDTAKLDIAALIAAVRNFAQQQAKPESAPADTTTSDPGTTAVTAATTSSIAALLARTTRAAAKAGAEQPASTPDQAQSAFTNVEALVTGQTPAKDEPVAPTTDGIKDAGPANAKLSELLARLTESSKPGAAPAPAPAPQPPTAHAAQQPIDPKLAAIAQAIQQASGDDKPVKGATNSSDSTASVQGVAPLPAASATHRADQTAATPQQPARAEELMNHHLDLAKDSQWLDTLARDITRAASSDSRLRFELNPEHLGSLKVELLNGAQGTSVKLTTETEAARAILADAQPRLVAEARAQGLRISEAQVNLGNQGGGQRHTPESPVMIRTASGLTVAEVDQDKPAASGERYA